MSRAESFAMDPEEYVRELYLHVLNRPADPGGLAHWRNILAASGDPTRVLKGFIESEEYQNNRPDRVAECEPYVKQALAQIHRQLRIIDVGAQSLGAGTHPYEELLQVAKPQIIGFDPLEEKLRERAETERSSDLVLLPYAIGDGRKHTLHINNDDGTSSLFPLNERFNACFNHLCELSTIATKEVQTYRLDDVLPEGPVDLLKLDVQGAELMVLEGAEKTLEGTAVVHCEVEFGPIYLDQPLFPEIQSYLLRRNFSLIDLLIPPRYHYITPSRRNSPDRLLWADAIFFRDKADRETKAVQALLAASMYRKPTLAEFLLLSASKP